MNGSWLILKWFIRCSRCTYSNTKTPNTQMSESHLNLFEEERKNLFFFKSRISTENNNNVSIYIFVCAVGTWESSLLLVW